MDRGRTSNSRSQGRRMAAGDGKHALGGGFRYRHGTQSAAPGPAQNCPIGLDGGIGLSKGGAERHHDTCFSGDSFPMRRGHTRILFKNLRRRGHRRKALATSRVNRRLSFSSQGLALVMDLEPHAMPMETSTYLYLYKVTVSPPWGLGVDEEFVSIPTYRTSPAVDCESRSTTHFGIFSSLSLPASSPLLF